ncbi:MULTISPECIES: hypothetical protein [unclassified Paracoccus (in: a-proteobacteria)]|uniref:hypothetical protein n=1 Tax=unclassified Paracoccus (in: a-proteobacteria) TaxID=2688777 RepID=UPI001F43853A|nr:hypothetical protein [Paracoccus sp. MC1862]
MRAGRLCGGDRKAAIGFWGGLVVAPLAVTAPGEVLYLVFIRKMRRVGLRAQVLVTFGLIFVVLDLTRIS